MSVWGTLGATTTFTGASGRSWNLRFERRLAPKSSSATANPHSTVWLVRDLSSTRLFAAKRQLLASAAEIDALVDEASAWRAACLADQTKVLPDLVDVLVDRSPPLAVTFLAEFCARGLLPRSKKLSEQVLLTIALDLAVVTDQIPRPHGHIAHESLLVDEAGSIKLAGFGAHRSAILRDNPGLTREDDVFDIGLLLYELVFGGQPDEQLSVPQSDIYGPQLTDIIVAALAHVPPQELARMATAAGAAPRAPVVNVDKDSPQAAPDHIRENTERNVKRLVKGEDIGQAFPALLDDLKREPNAVARGIFESLFKEPVSKDPVCAMRALTMLHNLVLDGPEEMLTAVRKNDRFMEWAENSWTREAIQGVKAETEGGVGADVVCFVGGELAFYAAALRRKAKFHMLAAGGYTGKWERTGAVNQDGKDVLTMRRRKVIGGMADMTEMFSELGCRLASATDSQSAVKQEALGAMVSECCLCATAGVTLAFDTETIRDAQKVADGTARLHMAARALVFAVEKVPSAGGEQWVEQFASDDPPDVVANAVEKERDVVGPDETEEIPVDGWAETEEIVQKTEKQKKKEKKERKKKKKKLEAEAKKKEVEDELKAKEDITAADGALVVHGAGDEAAQKVATMFGDLLSIDEGENVHVPIPEAPRPTANMSNAQALAMAFGVSEDAVGGQHLALPAPGDYDDDDDDEGGYENYKARQEARQTQTRQVGSTAAWAARRGYRPPREEDTNGSRYDNDAYERGQRRDSIDNDDDSDQQPIILGPGPSEENQRPQSSYYDDYDSYESVTYSIEDEPSRNIPVPTYKPPPRQEPVPTISPLASFTIEKKYALNLKRLRTGDRVSANGDVLVHKGEYNRETVAIKKLSKTGIKSESAVEEFKNEVMITSTLSHPALMKCIAAVLQKPNYILVTEFMKRGTLFDVLHKSRIKLTWALIRKIAIQLGEGMAHMHSRGIIHRDLKTLNIFVDGSYNIKIGDFGLSRYESNPSFTDHGIAGTYQYMAPEVLRGEPHTQKSDVYSFAQVMCEMVSGVPPFQGMDAREVGERVVREDIRPQIPMHCQRAYINLIQMCWGTAPETRPPFSEIVELIKSTTK